MNEHAEVDIDLLADYIGGALDGPAAAEVTRLVAEDPRWRETYELLAPGMAEVGAGLRALGAHVEPMPADVAARLDAALAAADAGVPPIAEPRVIEAGLTGPTLADPTLAGPTLVGSGESHFASVRTGEPHLAPVGEPHGTPARNDEPHSATPHSDEPYGTTPRTGERHLHVVRGGGAEETTGRGTDPTAVPGTDESPGRGTDQAAVPGTDVGSGGPARRRSRLRWAAPIAAAAGVIAFAAVGIDQLSGSGSAEDTTSAAGSSAEQAAPAMASPLLISVPTDDRIGASGTDYSPSSLGDEPSTTMAAPGTRQRSRKGSRSAPETGVAPVEPEPLGRLRVGAALGACLEAIAQERGGTPIAVQTVDYARFRGAPAVIVRFVAEGVTWAVAAGPECGTRGSGASSLQTLRVG